MQLIEFLDAVPVDVQKSSFEINYYDDYSWEQLEPYKVLCYSGFISREDINTVPDGELMCLSITPDGAELHVVA